MSRAASAKIVIFCFQYFSGTQQLVTSAISLFSCSLNAVVHHLLIVQVSINLGKGSITNILNDVSIFRDISQKKVVKTQAVVHHVSVANFGLA